MAYTYWSLKFWVLMHFQPADSITRNLSGLHIKSAVCCSLGKRGQSLNAGKFQVQPLARPHVQSVHKAAEKPGTMMKMISKVVVRQHIAPKWKLFQTQKLLSSMQESFLWSAFWSFNQSRQTDRLTEWQLCFLWTRYLTAAGLDWARMLLWCDSFCFRIYPLYVNLVAPST